MGKCEVLKKPNPDSQNKKNEHTLCQRIGINGFYTVNQKENKGKMEWRRKLLSVSLDTAEKGRRLGCGSSRSKKQRTGKSMMSSSCHLDF